MSNDDLTFTRNRIRHQLIPFLEQYNPEIRQTLGRTADILTHDYDDLARYTSDIWHTMCHSQGKSWARFALNTWGNQSIGQQRALLRHVMKKISGRTQDLSYQMIESARDILTQKTTGKIALLAHGVQLHIFYDEVIAISSHHFKKADYGIAFDVPQIDSNKKSPLLLGKIVLLSQTWHISFGKTTWDETDWKDIKQDRWQAVLQLHSACKPQIRTRKTGDRFRPYGASGSKKLKDWMIDRKIPAVLRDNWPLVVDSITDEILWVVGYEISQSAAVKANTTQQINYLIVHKTEQ